MKGIPKSTSAFLEDIVRPFPKAPYTCAKAILNFMSSHYGYGCDENLEQERWARYPDQVTKYMTCQEYGIFLFLLSKQAGLDSILLSFDGYDGADQSHLATFIKGRDQNYLLSEGDLQRVKSFSKKKMIVIDRKEQEELSFSKMTLLDVPEIIGLIDSFKGPDGFQNFFGKGQLLSAYYAQNEKRNIIFRTSRFIKIQDGNVTLRKSFEFLGYAFNIFFSKDAA